MDDLSPISHALRLARTQGRALLDAEHGKDGDFLIFDALSDTLRYQYEPLARPLSLILNDMDFVSVEDPSPQTRFIAERIRNAVRLIGSMVASNEVQGFGNKSGVIDAAKQTIRDQLMLASATYGDRPNILTTLNEDQATQIAAAIAQRMQHRITEMRKLAAGTREV